LHGFRLLLRGPLYGSLRGEAQAVQALPRQPYRQIYKKAPLRIIRGSIHQVPSSVQPNFRATQLLTRCRIQSPRINSLGVNDRNYLIFVLYQCVFSIYQLDQLGHLR
jgi:hypothetical protein